MANKQNLEEMSIEDLRKLHAELKEDLSIYRNDVGLLRQAYPGRLTMYEGIYQNPSSSEDIPEPTVLQTSNKVKDKQLLHHLEIHSGVKVSEIFLNDVTTENNDGEYFRYDVKCSVDKINLELSFVSNAKFTENHLANIDEPYELTDLKINVLSEKYKMELQKTVEYFSENSAYLGAFFLCVQEYSKLFNMRRQVLKKLLVDNGDYIEISLENDSGHYKVECNGAHVDTVFFILVWGLIFDLRTCSVRDSFKINIHEDEQLVSDVNPLFKQLCNRDSQLSEEDKLNLLSNVMNAVKAADLKLDALSTVSTEVSQVQKNI